MYKPTFTSKTVAVALAIAAASSIWLTIQAKAQDQRTSGLLAYGIAGIASGQTARLNVVTVGVRHEVPMELTFLDRQGNVLARSVERAVPGQAVSLDLHFVPGAHGTRLPFRGLVRWATQLGPEGYVIPSVELIDDATGRTTVLLVNPEG